MKSLTLLFLLGFSTISYARKCEVYGISDSPQKMSCYFDNLKINLSCKNGTYYLNSSLVKAAYHYDVEFGSVPLVFEASEMKMIVVMEPKLETVAELERKGRSTLMGTCR